MARLVWALFCEHHLTDASGKNSYIGVFDETTMAIRGRDIPDREPLPQPVHTPRFVLALHLTADPGAPEAAVRVLDVDEQPVIPEIKCRLPEHQMGRHYWQINFADGIPVTRTGVYTFKVLVDGESIGQAELPIRLDLP